MVVIGSLLNLYVHYECGMVIVVRSCSSISFKHLCVCVCVLLYYIIFIYTFNLVWGVSILGATPNNISLKYEYPYRNTTK